MKQLLAEEVIMFSRGYTNLSMWVLLASVVICTLVESCALM